MTPTDRATQIQDLVKDLSPREAVQLVLKAQQANLAEQEDSKEYTLRYQKLPDADFLSLCTYMLDGGGVTNRTDLAASIIQNFQAGEQPDDFWPRLMHFVKSTLKVDGHIRQVSPEGAVKINTQIARSVSALPTNLFQPFTPKPRS